MKLPLLILLSLLVSCAGLKEDYVEENCDYNAGFEEGAKAARSQEQMRGEALARDCPENKKTEVRKGYRTGYLSISQPKKQKISKRRNKLKSPFECMEDLGTKVCGYNCLRFYDEVKCANEPHHKCLEHDGEITCGKDCKLVLDEIQCEKELDED